MDLLKLLCEEAAGITEPKLMSPSAVEEGDTVVGEASEEARKLYVLWQQYERRAAEALVRFRFNDLSDEECRLAVESQIHALKTKASILHEAFWAQLKDEFGLWGADGIGIREGWKVVTLSPAEARARSLAEALFEAVTSDCGNPNCPIHGPRARARAEKAAAEDGS